VLIPEGDPLIADAGFRAAVLGATPPRATLAYGEPVMLAGLHLVQTDTDHWVENVTGLAACGAHLVVGAVGDGPQQGHPFVPVLQVVGSAGRHAVAEEDVDFAASGAKGDGDRLAELALAAARRDVIPAAQAAGFVEFQLTRGLLGVST
jgi:altronate dehydratase